MKQFDAIIIGFGKGGKTLAVELSKRNWSVAMIERSDRMYGGTCINIGCIPTKALIHQAKVAQYLNLKSFELKKEYYKKAVEKKNELTALLRKKNYANLADRENITVYNGRGSFLSEDTVLVEMKNEFVQLKSKHIFINTGAESVIPSIEGVRESKYVYTSTSLMDLEKLPLQLIIVGGGYIGLEFASMYASFGSQVTVLEGYPELIPREDRDIAANVKEVLEKKGVVFKMNARVQAIHDDKGKAVLSYFDVGNNERKEIRADAVLLATGRKPVTEGLNLDAAGIQVNERGAIIVDEYLKTTNPHVWALGDVKGGLQFTYISLDDYRIVREELFGEKKYNTEDRLPVSYSVFIDPPLSHIGMNEEEAKKRNIDVRVVKIPVNSIPRVKTLGETDGLLKAVIEKGTNKILGCTLFCPESSEIINIVALAMKAGKDANFLRDFIFTHPSMGESFNDLFA